MKIFILAIILFSPSVFSAQGVVDADYVIYRIDTDDFFLNKSGERPKRIGWPVKNGGALEAGFDPNIILLEVTEDVRPIIDRDTQDISAARVIDIQNTEWRREFTVTAKSQAEIDEIAANNALRAACQAVRSPENRDLLRATVAGDFENNAQRNQRLALLSQIIACLY